MTWPTTSQSNSIRSAARCCFTVGLACVACSSSMNGATLKGLIVVKSNNPRPSHQSENLHAAL